MLTKGKIESYILQMELPYEELDDSLWVLYESEENTDLKLVITLTDVLVHFRVKVMNMPENKSLHCQLFRKLLELNTLSLTHGAFAIEEDVIVLLDSLQAENIDFNEFQASVDALFLGLRETYDELSQFAKSEAVS